ncbi:MULTISPECIES: thiopeptide-type bacteriocin biosynthesis protein [unclassified Streptomyces]|uniref:thiopeptide-type bacteriocin biosynthesis protein n=1 Tax=unclassified Streptomyces TaxID=2593676 RepID=UPI000DBA81BE|nr:MULTISPECIES: thiopeptide-type bacteriocin biosynthesis protein [unclassified Streptomyces]MYT68318.1 methyltransferase [Streptomyces sp. SID8367]RAJ76954.1 thiopeptide-type bacteriocin biosynthesis protein [Streptomyces sp. PsTaAH-137]
MPAHQLTPTAYPRITGEVSKAVLDVLAGQPIDATALRAGITPSSLTDAVDAFVAAGTDALFRHQHQPHWVQVYVEFPNWHDADQIAYEHLVPLLRPLEADGSASMWWFIRKHPYWRMRVHTEHQNHVSDQLDAHLDNLVQAGHLRSWLRGHYEPEIAAFGGPTGMLNAHLLFASDSQHILNLQGAPQLPLGRREISVLLCTVMMRAAGLELGEQGDVWDRVINEEHRNIKGRDQQMHAMAEAIRPLLLADLSDDGPLFGPDAPLQPIAEWAASFRLAGDSLKAGVATGTLERGLRRTLAYQIIFHWNRLGLSTGVQSGLALAARTAILHPPN